MVDLIQILIYVSGATFFLSMILLFFIFPFRKLLWNRWKLKMKAKKGFLPVYMRHKNRQVEEIIVNTKEPTFTHKDATYNIREESIHEHNGFRCLFYSTDNPEPLRMSTEDAETILVKREDGSISELRGKLVDSIMYNQTCQAFYYAGMAFANRNKSILNILIMIAIGCVVIFGLLNFYKSGEAVNICKATIQNMSVQMQTVV